MTHPIDPKIIEAIEDMAKQAAANDPCVKEEVIKTWTAYFHDHATAAVLAANEKAALHCEARAAQEEERAAKLQTYAPDVKRPLEEELVYRLNIGAVQNNARVCRALAAEIRLLGKTWVVQGETKEIDSCMACPMRVDMRPYADVCSHWGSPEGNQIDSFERAIPAWCPIETKPLLLRAVRR